MARMGASHGAPAGFSLAVGQYAGHVEFGERVLGDVEHRLGHVAGERLALNCGSIDPLDTELIRDLPERDADEDTEV